MSQAGLLYLEAHKDLFLPETDFPHSLSREVSAESEGPISLRVAGVSDPGTPPHLAFSSVSFAGIKCDCWSVKYHSVSRFVYVFVYVCVYMCVHVCGYVYVLVGLHVCICTCMYYACLCLHVCVHLCAPTCMHVCMHVYLCLMCMFLHVYVFLYISVYV